MTTQEERLSALEQRVADIELERLYEQRKAASATPSEQAYDFKQTSHRLTMLLGIASGQEHDIRAIKNDVGIIKEQVTGINQEVNGLHVKLDQLEKKLDQRFASLEGKFEQLLLALSAQTSEKNNNI